MTKDQLRISTDGIAGPYLMVLLAQHARVRERLDRRSVCYWVDPDAISLDGKPMASGFAEGQDAGLGEIPGGAAAGTAKGVVVFGRVSQVDGEASRAISRMPR